MQCVTVRSGQEGALEGGLAAWNDLAVVDTVAGRAVSVQPARKLDGPETLAVASWESTCTRL